LQSLETRQLVERGSMRARAVAEFTGLPLPEVYRLAREGVLKSVRAPGGRRVLLLRASVEDYLAQGLRETA
jgi:excisionase family DNA binding protein